MTPAGDGAEMGGRNGVVASDRAAAWVASILLCIPVAERRQASQHSRNGGITAEMEMEMEMDGILCSTTISLYTVPA